MDIGDMLRKLKIEALNDMQQETSDAVLHTDKDVVVLSPTGSGKTLAYLLPLAGRLSPELDELQAVVVVPGRELALQSADVCRSMGSGLRPMALYGGRAAMDEHRQLMKTRPQIIFATPGRLNDHISKGNISVGGVRWLIIDEFDKCLRMGFRKEMSAAIERLPHVERRILLSATDAEEIPAFVRMGRTVRIDFHADDEQVPERVSLFTVKSPDKDKLNTLCRLLCSFGDAQTIVFLNFRDSVERTAGFLRGRGFTVSEFHGGKSQQEREDAIYKFSNGSANVLIGTDLASRGLDMPDVDNIVHCHLPVGEEEYVHRVGRTARWDAKGRAFFLLGPTETLPEYVSETPEEYSLPAETPAPPQPRMVTLYIGKGKKDKISKGDVLGFLCKTGGINGSDIGRIDVKDRYTYAAVSRSRWRDAVRNASGQKLKGVRTVVEPVK